MSEWSQTLQATCNDSQTSYLAMNWSTLHIPTPIIDIKVIKYLLIMLNLTLSLPNFSVSNCYKMKGKYNDPSSPFLIKVKKDIDKAFNVTKLDFDVSIEPFRGKRNGITAVLQLSMLRTLISLMNHQMLPLARKQFFF